MESIDLIAIGGVKHVVAHLLVSLIASDEVGIPEGVVNSRIQVARLLDGTDKVRAARRPWCGRAEFFGSAVVPPPQK